MHREPYLPAYLAERGRRLVDAAFASSSDTDESALEEIARAGLADQIRLGQPRYLEEPWVRRMSAGPEHSFDLVRRGIYAGDSYDVSYQRYQLPLESGAEFVSVGVNGGTYLDPMFLLHRGDHIEVRASDDNHRDELIRKVEARVEQANATIANWNETRLPPLVENEAAKRRQQQESAGSRRAQLEADGFAPAKQVDNDHADKPQSEKENNISVFINGGFAVDANGQVQTSGPHPLDDQELAAQILVRVVSFGGIASARRRPARHHIEVSPSDPRNKIQVSTPLGASELSPIGLRVDELADQIAAIIDGADPNTVEISDTQDAGPNDQSSRRLVDIRLARTVDNRQPFRGSIEQVVAETQRLEGLGAWVEGSPEFAQVQRRKRFLLDYMQFPADDDASEQAEADRMAMTLEGQNLTALAEIEPGADELVESLLPILSTAAEVDGSDSDGEVARHVAVATDEFLSDVIASTEEIQNEELAQLVSMATDEDSSVLKMSLAWAGSTAESKAQLYGPPVPVAAGVATIITSLFVFGASAATVGPAIGIAVGLLWGWLRNFRPTESE